MTRLFPVCQWHRWKSATLKKTVRYPWRPPPSSLCFRKPARSTNRAQRPGCMKGRGLGHRLCFRLVYPAVEEEFPQRDGGQGESEGLGGALCPRVIRLRPRPCRAPPRPRVPPQGPTPGAHLRGPCLYNSPVSRESGAMPVPPFPLLWLIFSTPFESICVSVFT